MLQSLSPGGVKTEFAIVAGYQNMDTEMFNQMSLLDSKDIADAVIYILGTPPHVQIWISLKHETSGASKYSNSHTLDSIVA